MYEVEKKINQRIQLLLLSGMFKVDLQKIKNTYTIPNCGIDKIKVLIFTYHHEPGLFEGGIFDEIRKLCSKYDLSELYFLYIFFYLMTGQFVDNLAPIVHNCPSDNKDFALIKIYKETNTEDVRLIFTELKNELNHYNDINSRFKDIPNLERDFEIYGLYKSGKSSKEIAQIINTNFSNTNDSNKMIGYEDVSKIVKKLEERVSELLPHKET